MRECTAPIPDEALLDYWTGESAAGETEAVEEHLFACADCTTRLSELAAVAAGVAALARQGRLSGIVPRGLLNRLQRDGLRVRLYALAPGETVPCTAYPGDDIVVAALRADLSQVAAVSLSMVGPVGAARSAYEDVPVSPSEGEVLLALPGSVVREIPSARLRITLTSSDDDRHVLGEYVLEHTGPEATPG